MSPSNAFWKFSQIVLFGILIPTTPLAAQEESRWDSALKRLTPLVDLNGQMVMTDPCFYYLSFGSEWLKGTTLDNIESEQVKLGIQPNYGDIRLNDETLQSCHYWAQRGKSSHQYALGLMYMNGDQVNQNHARAFYWLTLATRAGHKLAPLYRDKAKDQISNQKRQSVLNAVQKFEPLAD